MNFPIEMITEILALPKTTGQGHRDSQWGHSLLPTLEHSKQTHAAELEDDVEDEWMTTSLGATELVF